MNFINRTPFPALNFEGIDQHDRSFYVVVLRQTLSFATGTLEYADQQAPLCEVDEHFGVPGASSVRQESDLCPFKPKCDVIVNASAYAPGGIAKTQIDVRLIIKKADSAADKNLIEKKVRVTGERAFTKKAWVVRAVQWCIKWSTLTLIQLSPWFRTKEDKFTSLPLRYEFAFGGQWRINDGDSAAKRVRTRNRLTPAQLANHPDGEAEPGQRPVAHSEFEPNPIGRGFAPKWALRATNCIKVPAPRIERIGESLSARQFWKWQTESGRPTALTASIRVPAGMGVRHRTDPARLKLVGTVDDSFIAGTTALPGDFDFAYHNAAPLDQQTPYLLGDEIVELTNLCPPDTPGLSSDSDGNSVLPLSLPRHECFCLVRFTSGEIQTQPMAIDTVMIEPDEHSLTLVWRLLLSKDNENPIRVCEARMQTHDERDRFNAAIDHLEKLHANSLRLGNVGANEALQ